MGARISKEEFIDSYVNAFLLFDNLRILTGPLRVITLFKTQAKRVLDLLESFLLSPKDPSVSSRETKRLTKLPNTNKIAGAAELLDNFLFSFLLKGRFYSRKPKFWNLNSCFYEGSSQPQIIYAQTGWQLPLIFRLAGKVFEFHGPAASYKTNLGLVDILKGKKSSDYDFKFLFQPCASRHSLGVPDFSPFNLSAEEKQFLRSRQDVLVRLCQNYALMQQEDFFVFSNINQVIESALGCCLLKISEDDPTFLELGSLRVMLKKIADLLIVVEKALYSCWTRTSSAKQVDTIVSLKTVASVCSNKEKEWLKRELKANKHWIGFLQDCGFKNPASLENFLKVNAPLCTEFFNNRFKAFIEQKLSQIKSEELGLIICSDNWQAIKFLSVKGFNNKVDVVYIDPPYNTKTKVFAYNDTFDLRAWISLLSSRLILAKELLKNNGVVFISIDDNELATLMNIIRELFKSVFLVKVRMRNPRRQLAQLAMFQKSVEFLLICSKQKNFGLNRPKVPYDFSEHRYKVSLQKAPIETFKVNGHIVEMYSPDCYQLIKLREGNPKALKKISIRGKIKEFAGKFYETYLRPFFEKHKNYDYLFKVYGIGEDGLGFRYFKHPSPKTVNGVYFQGVPLEVQRSSKKEREISLSDFWDFESAMNVESKRLRNMGLSFFKSIKPVDFLMHILSLCKNPQLVLDFFAGSGSLAHAALSLRCNSRIPTKFILVDNNLQCVNLMKRRIIKLFQSFKWKRGEALDSYGISGFVKVLTLESFEDKLLKFNLKPPA